MLNKRRIDSCEDRYHLGYLERSGQEMAERWRVDRFVEPLTYCFLSDFKLYDFFLLKPKSFAIIRDCANSGNGFNMEIISMRNVFL